jgi:predicted amidohydrolase YtcJ
MNRSAGCIAASCLLVFAFAAGCGTGPKPADLIILNGRLVTVDDEMPAAQALAARDGMIVAVGTDEEIERYRGMETKAIDLAGHLAIPGFIEGHAHFIAIGQSKLNIDLRKAKSWEEVVDIVAEVAGKAETGQWILGWGWHQDKWDSIPEMNVEGYPTHHLLSRATPDNPVMLKHAAGGHAGVINAAAMELIGIDSSTPDPAGGKILHDSDGKPTGVLREKAYSTLALDAYERALEELTPKEREAQRRREIELAAEECLSNGVTSFQDAGSEFDEIDLLLRMAAEGRTGVRLWVMLGEDDNAILKERIKDYRILNAADGRFTVRAIKRYIDGALGSHGAWLLKPYSDLPGSVGHNTSEIEDLERAARIAIENDFQLCVHAIGDRGNRETLDLYERIFATYPDKKGLRWRIEHAQHLHPDDIPRFAELDVVASMQGIHCISDGPWVPTRLGEDRAESGAYVWRKLIDSGAVISNGTDAPIEDVNPIPGFYALVTRRMSEGAAFYPEQRMTRMEALKAYTINAAYAAFEEEIKGSLTPGKLADITVLSEDILTVSEERILETKVLYTIVGGEVLYRGQVDVVR